MSLADVLKLAGKPVPGLDAAIKTVGVIYTQYRDVKVYREQCGYLASRCIALLLAVHESSADMVGTSAMMYADEIEGTIAPIRRKIEEWATYSRVKSLFNITIIKDGLDTFYRDIDACFTKFNVQMNMELTKGQRDQKLIQERDRAEMRELLQNIANSVEELKAIQQMPSPATLEIMQSIEEELDDPGLETSQKSSLQQDLARIRERTQLPPMTNLTGQIERVDEHPVALGTFNDIYIGIWAGDRKVALRLPRALPNNRQSQNKFEKEVDIWRRLNHPNIVRLYGIAYFGTRAYMVSHWMDHGNAIGYVQNHPDSDRLRILYEVASGLEYLHMSNIVHGDLRGANVLISARGKACLTDFGFSTVLEEFSQGASSTTGAANSRWSAPEILNPALIGQSRVTYSTSTDVWSYGMLCIELMTGHPPFLGIANDITVAISLSGGQLPHRPTNCPGITHDMWILMQRCWDKRPMSRPSMTAVKTDVKRLRGDFPDTPNLKLGPLISSPQQISADLPHGSKQVPPSMKIKIGRSPTTSSQASRKTKRPSSASSLLGRFNPFSHSRLTSTDAQSPSSPDQLSPLFGSGTSATIPEISLSLPGNFGSHILSMTPVIDKPDSMWSRDSMSSGTVELDDSSIFRSRDGSIEAATLQALINQLVTETPDVRRSVEYRDVFLSTYHAFTTDEAVFSGLVSRFRDADASPGQHRTLLRIYIITILKYWVTCAHTRVDSAILFQIVEFAMSIVSSSNTASRMKELAKDLMMASGQPNLPSSPTLISGHTIPKITPPANGRDLAIGLTVIEGEHFARILPGDCIYHLRGQPEKHIRLVSETNNKIVYWVKRSVLRVEDLKSRSNLVEFFIFAAQLAYEYRNFASMSAIVTALSSTTLTRLELTFDCLDSKSKSSLEAMIQLLDPRHNFSAYRAALNSSNKPCIPLFAVHIHDLHAAISQGADEVDINGATLINFAKWRKFYTTTRDILQHKYPDMSKHRHAEVLVYLEHQLRSISVSKIMDEGFEKQSKKVAEAEAPLRHQRVVELDLLGM